MKPLKILGVFLIGAIAGIVALITVMRSESNDMEKVRMDLALERLSKTEAHLGIRCSEVDQLLLAYLKDIETVLAQIKAGQKLVPTEPIFGKDQRILMATTDCGIAKSTFEMEGNPLLKDVVWGRESVRQDIYLISTSLHRAAADWCDGKCLGDVASKMSDAVSSIRYQMSELKGAS